MNEKEFLLKLNSIIITDKYNNDFINNIFNIIKTYLKDDEIIYSKFKRNDDPTTNNDFKVTSSDILIKLDNSYLIIKKVKKELDNLDFFKEFLTSLLNNMFKNIIITDKLKNEKYTDSMLEIYNRLAYENLLKEKEFNQVGIIFLDVNYLGVINNTYGHEAGDLLLKTISSCLKKHFRKTDIYRIGGDEIVIIVKNIAEYLFISKTKDMLTSISNTPYSVSIGVRYEDKTCDLKSSVKIANFLMEEKKEEFRRNNPDKYINKYQVKFIGDKLK